MDEVAKGLYGKTMEKGPFGSLHLWALFAWLAFTLGVSALLTRAKAFPYPPGLETLTAPGEEVAS